jgi:hypothetical protein
MRCSSFISPCKPLLTVSRGTDVAKGADGADVTAAI